MNKLDLHAVPDAADAEEAAFINASNAVEDITGFLLFNEDPSMLDALLDAIRNIIDIPAGHDLFTVRDAGDWDDLRLPEKRLWDGLADQLRIIAFYCLDEDKASDLAAEHPDVLAS